MREIRNIYLYIFNSSLPGEEEDRNGQWIFLVENILKYLGYSILFLIPISEIRIETFL